MTNFWIQTSSDIRQSWQYQLPQPVANVSFGDNAHMWGHWIQTDLPSFPSGVAKYYIAKRNSACDFSL